MGLVLSFFQVAEDLGLELIKIDREKIPDNLLSMIASFTKVGFHSFLVTKVDGDIWTIVNYNGFRGSLISEINRNDIDFPRKGILVDRHYYVRLKK